MRIFHFTLLYDILYIHERNNYAILKHNIYIHTTRWETYCVEIFSPNIFLGHGGQNTQINLDQPECSCDAKPCSHESVSDAMCWEDMRRCDPTAPVRQNSLFCKETETPQ